MNYAVSVIFRAIPLAMMAVCVAFGAYVWTAPDGTAGNFVAGRVVTFLGAIRLVYMRTRTRGLGAICFSLYSIVSILESGTSSKQ